jgi:hypothetical protein
MLKGPTIIFAVHRRQTRFDAEASGLPASERANREQCREQTQESERCARDAKQRIDIHDDIKRTRR